MIDAPYDIVFPSSIKSECSKCGDCCKCLILKMSWDDVLSIRKQIRDDSARVIPEKGYVCEISDYRRMMVYFDEVGFYENIEPVKFDRDLFIIKDESLYTSSGISFFKCNLYSGEVGCSIHKNRPTICRRFRPTSQGGYIGCDDACMYERCSYRDEFRPGNCYPRKNTGHLVYNVG